MLDNLEKQLNRLPRMKLRNRADLKIRFRLYSIIWKKKLVAWQTGFSLQRAIPAIAAIVLFCLVSIVPGYAYASESITRGSFLYPVKQALEKIELSLPQSNEAKAQTYQKLADRRLDEAKVLSAKPSASSQNDLIATIGEAVVLNEQADALDNIGTISATSSIKDKHIEKLEKIARNVGLDGSDETIDALALAMDNLKGEHREAKQFIKARNFPQAGQAGNTGIASSTGTKENGTKASSSQNKFENKTIKKNKTATLETNGKNAAKKYASTTDAAAYFNTIKTRVDDLEKQLAASSTDQTEINKLFKRLDTKLDKAQAAIDAGDLEQYGGLIRSTEALTNNAKHFLKENSNKFEQKSDNGKRDRSK